MKSNPTSKSPRLGFQAESVTTTDDDSDASPTECVSILQESSTSAENKRKRLPAHMTRRWRKAAIWVIISCIIVSICFTLASFATSENYHSSSILALAFDTMLALITSCTVLWRFRDDKGGIVGDKRERVSLTVFGVSFILAGSFTIAVAIKRLLERITPTKSLEIIVMLLVSCMTYVVLAGLQYRIAKALQSSTMMGSCIDSALSAFLMLGLLFSHLVYSLVQVDLWYLDHAVAIGISFLTILCGLKFLIEVSALRNKLPIEAAEYE